MAKQSVKKIVLHLGTFYSLRCFPIIEEQFMLLAKPDLQPLNLPYLFALTCFAGFEATSQV